MKPCALTLLALLLAAAAFAATTHDVRSGVWTGDLEGNRLQLMIHFRDNRFGTNNSWNNTMGSGIDLSRVEGLTAEQINAPANDVVFAIRAAAGVVTLNGHFANGEGAGHFKFAPSEAFVGEMEKLGYTTFRDQELLVFAIHDLSPQTIGDLRAIGYDPARRELDEIAIFGINANVIREYNRMGFAGLTLREVVNLRVGRVDAEYVKAMRELGYTSLTAREAADMAILGVKPSYVRELREAGLTNLTTRDLRNLRTGNIDAKKIAAYRAAGYPNLTMRELGDFGIHGVKPELIEGLRKIGYDNIPARRLIELRVFNITPEYIQKMNAIGVRDLQKMIDLKATGAGEILLKKK